MRDRDAEPREIMPGGCGPRFAMSCGMTSSWNRYRGSAAALAIVLTTACVASDDEPAVDGEVEALNGSLSFIGCTAAQIQRLTSGVQIATSAMRTVGYQQCVKNAWTWESHGYVVEDIISRIRAMPTTIECVDWCGVNAIGCTGVGPYTGGPNPERISVVRSYLDDPNTTTASVAGVIAHEVAHTQGWNHPGDGGAMAYPFSVPEQVRACVAGTQNRFSRSDLRFDSELPKVGGEGGEIYKTWCPSGTHAVGVTAQADGTAVHGFQLRCSNGSLTSYIGGTGGTTVTDICAIGTSLAGFTGTSGSFVSSLRAGCESDADLAAANPTPSLAWTSLGGSTSGTAVTRLCPPGKAVVGALGRAGGYVDSVRWICRDVDAPPIPDAHVIGTLGGKDPTTMMASYQMCSGYGALVGLMGQAGAEVDQLDGLCEPRAVGLGPAGALVLEGLPLSHALEYGGGIGGLPYNLKCPASSAIVGLRGRSGGRIDAIGAVCAATAAWADGSTSSTTNLPIQGGSTGNPFTMMCPATEFIVGLEMWWKTTPELAGSPITVHAVSPMCRRLK